MKWAKGVIVKGSDGNNHLDINEEEGIKTYIDNWDDYLKNNNLNGYKIPSLGQADSLINYCSIQRVRAENTAIWQFVVYPAKKNEKIKGIFNNIKSTPMADIRKNGVYINSSQYYASRHLDRDGNYNPRYYYHYYYRPLEKDIFDYRCSSFDWRDCLLLPIKD